MTREFGHHVNYESTRVLEAGGWVFGMQMTEWNIYYYLSAVMDRMHCFMKQLACRCRRCRHLGGLWRVSQNGNEGLFAPHCQGSGVPYREHRLGRILA